MATLSSRMKKYEYVTRTFLTRRSPVIIRIDGKAFHSFTRKFQRPFDEILRQTMVETCKYLCANIMGCKLAYTQSDEISLLLVDYQSLDTEAWFDNNLSKIISISASMATLAFNKSFKEIVEKSDVENKDIYRKKYDQALFDARAFVLPIEEVNNYFLWRQQDASKNSINMVGQSEFAFAELQKLNTNQVQEKLWQERGINWNNFSVPNKRGTCIIKEEYLKGETIRHRWAADENIPIFSANPNYIERFVKL